VQAKKPLRGAQSQESLEQILKTIFRETSREQLMQDEQRQTAMPAQEVAVVVEDQDQLKDQDERREPPALDAKEI